MLINLARTASMFCVLAAAGLLPGETQAQTTDALIGTWNFNTTVTGCTLNCKYVGLIAFNPGGTALEERGTAVEYSGLGYVDRTALGKWRRSTAGTYPYTFTMKNFIFYSTGIRSGYILGTSNAKLNSTLNSLSGYGTAKIFNASGTLVETLTFTIVGTRF
jgi:hypothetical protein